MPGQIIELERLDMCERPGCFEAGNIGDRRARPDIDEDLVADEHAGAAVVQAHFDGLRRHETPGAHDQFRAARLVVLYVLGNLGFNHVALALANHRHVDRGGPGLDAVRSGMPHEIGDPRARNLVLARHTGDIGTGTSDPPALRDGSSSSGFCHVPRDELATGSTAKDQDFIPFWLSHGLLPVWQQII
jgi:hypothetical protein